MSVELNLSEITRNDNTIITVGSFDGVHVGHVKILSTLVNTAKEKKCRSIVLTFEPHPRKVISQNYSLKLLTTLEEKRELIYKLGVDEILIIPFTHEFSQMSSDDFFKNIIIDKIGIKEIILGYDHRFGRGRDGDETKVRQLGSIYNFDVTLVPEVKYDDLTVSSSVIRRELQQGKIKSSTCYLDRFYSITGKVIEGDKRGRLLGFPTANILVSNQDKMIPANGVYVVQVLLENDKYSGVMNIGNRPTFQDNEKVILEVHIFDFAEEIYNKEIKVEFVERIRDEQKFGSKEELIQQINRDKAAALQILTN